MKVDAGPTVDFILRYCPGKENAADYVLRHVIPFSTDEERTCGRRAAIVHQIIMNTVPKKVSLKKIQESTKSDLELQKLVPNIKQGRAKACSQ